MRLFLYLLFSNYSLSHTIREHCLHIIVITRFLLNQNAKFGVKHSLDFDKMNKQTFLL